MNIYLGVLLLFCNMALQAMEIELMDMSKHQQSIYANNELKIEIFNEFSHHIFIYAPTIMNKVLILRPKTSQMFHVKRQFSFWAGSSNIFEEPFDFFVTHNGKNFCMYIDRASQQFFIDKSGFYKICEHEGEIQLELCKRKAIWINERND